MDCLFNKSIPDSSKTELIFKPDSKTFITGIASSYNFYYDPSLESYMKESQFIFLTNSLNEELIAHWPCTICIIFSYIASPCTIGLSFLCPWSCISTSKNCFLEKLSFYNQQYFNPKCLNLSYNQKCSTSWIKLEVMNMNRIESMNDRVSNSQSSVLHRKEKEKENEINTQTEFLLRSVDSQMKVDLKK